MYASILAFVEYEEGNAAAPVSSPATTPKGDTRKQTKNPLLEIQERILHAIDEIGEKQIKQLQHELDEATDLQEAATIAKGKEEYAADLEIR